MPAANAYFETSVPSEQSFPSSQSVLENVGSNGADPLFAYNPDLSNLALQNMNLSKFNDLCRISEEGDALSAQSKPAPINRDPLLLPAHTVNNNSKPEPFLRESYSMFMDTAAQLTPMMEAASVVSEQVQRQKIHRNRIFQFYFIFRRSRYGVLMTIQRCYTIMIRTIAKPLRL